MKAIAEMEIQKRTKRGYCKIISRTKRDTGKSVTRKGKSIRNSSTDEEPRTITEKKRHKRTHKGSSCTNQRRKRHIRLKQRESSMRGRKCEGRVILEAVRIETTKIY